MSKAELLRTIDAHMDVMRRWIAEAVSKANLFEENRKIKLDRGEAWQQMIPSAKAFSLSNPCPEDVDLQDIACHLSGLNRYHGGTLLTVAEHAVRCSRRAPKGFEYEALHHDSHEAYLGDTSSPLKALLGDVYKAVAEPIDRAVRFALKLPWPPSPEIEEVDVRMLQTERLQLLGPEPRPWGLNVEPYPDEIIECWPPDVARARFLARHEELAP